MLFLSLNSGVFMECLNQIQGLYQPGKEDKHNNIISKNTPLLEISSKSICSHTTDERTSNSSLKRPLSVISSQNDPKRRKTTQSEENNAIFKGYSDRKGSTHSLLPIPFSAEQVISYSYALQKSAEIKKNYTTLLSTYTYYQNILKKEFEGSFNQVLRMDIAEAQAILGTVQGKTWWIRKGFYMNEEVYKGVIYENGNRSLCPFHTDRDFALFFNKISSYPYLETLRKEKISTIKKDYVLYLPLTNHYQNILLEESQEPMGKALQTDNAEVQNILSDLQKETWWIQKASYQDQEVYKGVIYLNGTYSYYKLHTDEDLIHFFNKNSSIPNLETLRREKAAKITTIKNEYIVLPSTGGYHQNVLLAESQELFDKALDMDFSRAEAILNDVQESAWWIRKGFHMNEEVYKGIVYTNGENSYRVLYTDEDLIHFFDENSFIPNLEILQKEKVNTIKDNCMVFSSSSRYCHDVLLEEVKEASNKAFRMDALEAEATLDNTQKETWWIRKGLHMGKELYKGIVYKDGKCSHYILHTGDDIIQFFSQHSSTPNLAMLRKKTLDAVKDNYMIHPFAKKYHSNVLEEESKGYLEIVHRRDRLEALTVLGTIEGSTWWIREGYYKSLKTHKGVVYKYGECTYHVLSTDQDLISFVNECSSIPALETLRKENEEEITAIKSKYMVQTNSIKYYKNTFLLECEGKFNSAFEKDKLEALSVLGTTRGKTWWIRKGLYNHTTIYKGITYINGQCTQRELITDTHLIDFVKEQTPELHIEALRNIKNDNTHNGIQRL